MKAAHVLLIVTAATGLAGCTTPGGPPVEVTRFHLDPPLERGTLSVEAASNGDGSSLEFQTYATPIRDALLAQGYAAPATGTTPQYVAIVTLGREAREGPPKPPKFSIGIGGGFGGGYHSGVGVGGDVAFPIGRRAPDTIVGTQLSVQIRRRSDGTVIWEGRARTEAIEQSAGGQPDQIAAKLTNALFLGFPGETGRTITVK